MKPAVTSFETQPSVRTSAVQDFWPLQLRRFATPGGTLASRTSGGTVPAAQIRCGTTTPYYTLLYGVVPHLATIRFLG